MANGCSPDPSANPGKEGSAVTTHHMQSVGGNHDNTGGQGEDTQYDKYTYSIISRNLPETWARTCTVVQTYFLQMMWTYTPIHLRSPSTSEAYATCVKEDGRQYCYAFIFVYNKQDGDSFGRTITKLK